MAIQERLLQFKLHIIIAAISAIALFSLLRHGPSFSTVLSFFWPLLLSTGFFLAAVALLLRISPPPSDDSVPSPGEDLIDYVSSGLPEPHCSVEEEPAGDREEEEEEEEEQRGEHQKSRSCSSDLPCGKDIVSLESKSHAYRIDIMLRVLLIIQQLLQDNKHASKRDIYYMDPSVFQEQGNVDRAINDICILLECSRHHLNVVCQAVNS